MVSPLFLMTAFSQLGIEPIRFWSVDREIDFHAFRRQCFNACNDSGSATRHKTAVAIMLQTGDVNMLAHINQVSNERLW